MRSYERGFTYLALVILIAIIGLVAVSSLQVGAIVQRRQAEEELLAIGKEYLDALSRYADATPAGQSIYPGRLEDLLVDPRYPTIRHHLRKLYIDPITGNNEWGVVYGSNSSGQGIVGIHSLSDAPTIKRDNFDAPFESFKDRKIYSEWVFTTIAPVSATPPSPNANPAPAAPPPKPARPGTAPLAPAPVVPSAAPSGVPNVIPVSPNGKH